MREGPRQDKPKNIDKGDKNREELLAITARIKQISSRIAEANDDDSDKMVAELQQLVKQRRAERSRITPLSGTAGKVSGQEPVSTGESDALNEVRKSFGGGTVFFGQKDTSDYTRSGREFTGGWNIVGAERMGASGEFYAIIERQGERVTASTKNLSRENPNTKFFQAELNGEKLGGQLENGGFKVGEYVVTEREMRHFVGGSAAKIAHFSEDGRFAYVGPKGFKREYLKITMGELHTATPKIGDRIRIFAGITSMTKEPITVRALEDLGNDYLINKVRGEDSEYYTVSKDSVLVVK